MGAAGAGSTQSARGRPRLTWRDVQGHSPRPAAAERPSETGLPQPVLHHASHPDAASRPCAGRKLPTACVRTMTATRTTNTRLLTAQSHCASVVLATVDVNRASQRALHKVGGRKHNLEGAARRCITYVCQGIADASPACTAAVVTLEFADLVAGKQHQQAHDLDCQSSFHATDPPVCGCPMLGADSGTHLNNICKAAQAAVAAKVV